MVLENIYKLILFTNADESLLDMFVDLNPLIDYIILITGKYKMLPINMPY